LGYDVLGIVFGVGLLLLATLAPRWPHPLWFLGLTLNWFSLAASNARSIANGSMWIIPFAIFAVIFGYGSLRAYGFYRRVRAPVRDQPSRS
jgi:cobalamin biosynthesis protein CobD/CbiB